MVARDKSPKDQSEQQKRLFGGSAPWDEMLAAAEQLPPPIGPDHMFELLGEVVRSGDVVVDIGGYGGRDAIEIAERFGCKSIVMDLVSGGLDGLSDSARATGVYSSVEGVQADAHALPLADASVDAIWSRDMFGCVCAQPFLEGCARVLKPGGHIVLHAVYFTELMAPAQRESFAAALSLSDGCVREQAERAMDACGLVVDRVVEVGSQWIEGRHLDGSSRLADDLLVAMRLRRHAEQLESRFGAQWPSTMLASYEWMVLMALGRLATVLYVLRRPVAESRRSKS